MPLNFNIRRQGSLGESRPGQPSEHPVILRIVASGVGLDLGAEPREQSCDDAPVAEFLLAAVARQQDGLTFPVALPDVRNRLVCSPVVPDLMKKPGDVNRSAFQELLRFQSQ